MGKRCAAKVGLFWASNSLWAGGERSGIKADTLSVVSWSVFGILFNLKIMQNE